MQPTSSMEELNAQNLGSHSDGTDPSKPVLEQPKSSTFGQNETPPGSAPIPQPYVPHPSLVYPPVFSQPPFPPTAYPSQPPAYYYPPPNYAVPSPYPTSYPTEPPPHAMYSAPPQYYPPPPYNAFVPPVETERHPLAPGLVEEKHSWALAAAAATVGSFVGLSAAAATRWWNGDDWYLVARDQRLSTTTTTDPQNVTPEKVAANSPPNSAEKEVSGEYTSRAMELLRRQQLPSDSSFHQESLAQLRDVQESLASIQLSLSQGAMVNECNGDTDSSGDRLMLRINTMLIKLESILGIDTCDIGFHEPTEPVRAPKVELEADTDIAAETPNSISTPNLTELIPIDREVLVFTLRQALTDLVLGKDTPSISHAEFIAGIQLLYLYASNISIHPHVPRYRRIYCENETYRQKVEKLSGAAALLEAIGFHLGQNSKYWEWMPHPLSSVEENRTLIENMYLERAREAVSALKVLKSASEDVNKEELLQSALQAAGIDRNSELDSNFSVFASLTANITSQNPETLLCDKDAISPQYLDTPFVCDTDLVTPEAATLLAGSAPTGDFQGMKEIDEIPPNDNVDVSESEVWK